MLEVQFIKNHKLAEDTKKLLGSEKTEKVKPTKFYTDYDFYSTLASAKIIADITKKLQRKLPS